VTFSGFDGHAMPIYRRTLAYFRPLMAQTIAPTLLTLLSIGINLLKPWLFKYIADSAGLHRAAKLFAR
jgi:hypothetical protein